MTQKMTQKEVRFFFRETDTVSFESLVCNKASIKDVSLAKVKAFLKETGTSLKVSKANVPMVLSSLGVLDKNKMTNAGALMFASNIEKAIHHSESILVAFKGKEKFHIFDRKDVRDDLFTQFNEAVAFLKKHLNIRSEIRGLDRHDIYEIPVDAWREAILNALIHRDYSIRGTSVYVMVYDDRVEIENPGKLASGVTVKSLGNSSMRRNPIIADLFHRMGKVERIGMGIKRMRDLCRDAGLKEPVFEIDPFFKVIFYRDPEYSLKRKVGEKVGDRVGKKVGDEVGINITDNQAKIISEMKNDRHISAGKLSAIVGISKRKIEANLAKLKEKGLIRRVGSARSGHWEVIENKGQ